MRGDGVIDRNDETRAGLHLLRAGKSVDAQHSVGRHAVTAGDRARGFALSDDNRRAPFNAPMIRRAGLRALSGNRIGGRDRARRGAGARSCGRRRQRARLYGRKIRARRLGHGARRSPIDAVRRTSEWVGERILRKARCVGAARHQGGRTRRQHEPHRDSREENSTLYSHDATHSNTTSTSCCRRTPVKGAFKMNGFSLAKRKS